MQTNLEKQKNEENSNIEKTQSMLSDLNQEIEDKKQIDNEENEKNDEEKKTNSFTFKPIGIGLT